MPKSVNLRPLSSSQILLISGFLFNFISSAGYAKSCMEVSTSTGVVYFKSGDLSLPGSVLRSLDSAVVEVGAHASDQTLRQAVRILVEAAGGQGEGLLQGKSGVSRDSQGLALEIATVLGDKAKQEPYDKKVTIRKATKVVLSAGSLVSLLQKTHELNETEKEFVIAILTSDFKEAFRFRQASLSRGGQEFPLRAREGLSGFQSGTPDAFAGGSVGAGGAGGTRNTVGVVAGFVFVEPQSGGKARFEQGSGTMFGASGKIFTDSANAEDGWYHGSFSDGQASGRGSSSP